jgi:hypothetical protein
MRLWVFKRHFWTIFQLYIDLWATFPGANMVHGRNTLGCNRHFLLQSCAHEFWNIVDQMSDKFESQHSLSPTIWSDIVVRRETISLLNRYFIAIIYMRLWVFKRHFSTICQLYIDLWATFPGANMVQGRNTLGYLRNRTSCLMESYSYI